MNLEPTILTPERLAESIAIANRDPAFPEVRAAIESVREEERHRAAFEADAKDDFWAAVRMLGAVEDWDSLPHADAVAEYFARHLPALLLHIETKAARDDLDRRHPNLPIFGRRNVLDKADCLRNLFRLAAKHPSLRPAAVAVARWMAFYPTEGEHARVDQYLRLLRGSPEFKRLQPMLQDEYARDAEIARTMAAVADTTSVSLTFEPSPSAVAKFDPETAEPIQAVEDAQIALARAREALAKVPVSARGDLVRRWVTSPHADWQLSSDALFGVMMWASDQLKERPSRTVSWPPTDRVIDAQVYALRARLADLAGVRFGGLPDAKRIAESLNVAAYSCNARFACAKCGEPSRFEVHREWNGVVHTAFRHVQGPRTLEGNFVEFPRGIELLPAPILAHKLLLSEKPPILKRRVRK